MRGDVLDARKAINGRSVLDTTMEIQAAIVRNLYEQLRFSRAKVIECSQKIGRIFQCVSGIAEDMASTKEPQEGIYQAFQGETMPVEEITACYRSIDAELEWINENEKNALESYRAGRFADASQEERQLLIELRQGQIKVVRINSSPVKTDDSEKKKAPPKKRRGLGRGLKEITQDLK